MSIRRTHLPFEDKYTQVPNEWVRDGRITRKARGLLVELMSHRPGWVVTTESLSEGSQEGRDAIRSAIRELVRFGYLKRERERGEDGTLRGVDYVICDPWDLSPATDNPTLADPPTKKTITQKDLTKTSQRQSRPIEPSVATDPKLSSVQKGMASRSGIHSIGPIMDVIAIHCQRKVTASAALTLALEILGRARTTPSAPGRYVMAAIRKTPFEWQKYLDEAGLGS